MNRNTSGQEIADVWEYRVIKVAEKDLVAQTLEPLCNELGAQGWELVSAMPLAQHAYGGTTGARLFFKRQLAR